MDKIEQERCIGADYDANSCLIIIGNGFDLHHGGRLLRGRVLLVWVWTLYGDDDGWRGLEMLGGWPITCNGRARCLRCTANRSL